MNMHRFAVAALSAAVCLVLAPDRPAQQPDPLGFGVPDGVHIYVHGRTSPTPDPGMVRLEKAVQHLVESRVHEDILDLIAMDLSRRQAEELRAGVAQALEIVGRVDWGTLMGREVVFSERLAVPMPEYLFLCRVPEEETAAQLDGIEAMLVGFAEMIGAPPDSVRSVERRTGPMVVFALEGIPVQIAAGAVGDAIVLSTSTRSTAAAMKRLGGDGSGSIVASERFAVSVGELPEGTESTAFFDVSGLFRFGSQLLQLAEVGVGGDEEALAVIVFLQRLFEEIDLCDHVAVSSSSDGTTVTDTILVRMSPGYAETRLAGLFQKQEPWTEWYRHVPADATNFVFDTGVDVAGLFGFIESLVEESFDDQLMPWISHPLYAEIRARAAYLSGEAAFVSFPSADGRGCGESVMWLRLEQTDGVHDGLGAHLRGTAKFLKSRGQQMSVTSNQGLFEVELAAFPWIHPVVGVRGDHIVLATSPAAVARIDRVQRGEEPDIRSSETFRDLGMDPANQGTYIEYGRLDSGMAALADVAGAAGFFMSLLPEDRDTRPLIKIGAILTKLAPAMRELDMQIDYGSEVRASQTSDSFVIRNVYRYRQPR